MSVLATISDIKIPYPTEGIIRTAQLDDTVTPENSVQLAVNMNFDRVGAIQTRLGVTNYADALVDAINNYGTLRNSVIPDGYDFIFQLGVVQDLSVEAFAYPSAVKVSDTKIAIFWSGVSGDGFCRNFSVDPVAGTITPIGALVEFDTTNNAYNKAILFNASLVVNVWQGSANGAYAAAFDVSGDTITHGTIYNFDSAGFQFGIANVDSTHVIVTYGVTSGSGLANILAINLGTLAITEPGATLTFASGGTVMWNSMSAYGDGTHFINFWTDGSDGKVQVFLVNTGTWAITVVGTALTFSVVNPVYHNCIQIDATHYVDIFKNDGIWMAAQAFAVNAGTFAVTTVGTPLPQSIIATQLIAAIKLDSSHFVVAYTSNSDTGFVRMLDMNGSYVITEGGNVLSGYEFGTNPNVVALNYSSDQAVLVWGDFTSGLGQGAFFQTFGTVVDGQFLYAGSGTSVFNTSGTSWTARRTGLATVSKPRFSQFLNYIWMVNGNEQIGGDAVATSSGGNFGNDLVPTAFPPGDFIHAGFEGRVWVANKTLGVIYYTDIVQFVPPASYSLTFNAGVNFISQLAPQTGQSFTGLFRVPRALLVFTQDNIYRIYGASSVDAYPAYNVGTFSQESIVETKTGIFFHHSSGFYQFDYGSQPVEISRRIIDFVKAIDREFYEDIVGVYDGFDCVEWSVGQVTVEGVTFTNCVLRYTISTQVWTVYDYKGNEITAMIYYDDGEEINHLMGTEAGKTGAMDVGYTDFGEPFYFEFIDRWRSFTDMYYKTKTIPEFSVYSENAAGANLSYQIQKSGPNAWLPINTVTADNNSILSNKEQRDFDVMRLRLAGNTKGAQVVVHGIEITTLTIKGQEEN